ncbi:hypothetical protein BX600DRAFT_441937 [Xylariales sp. PMI_506]|nr:hypothetical protein BX600DRAFT_441937 [Xylariales sp. PMI_506]
MFRDHFTGVLSSINVQGYSFLTIIIWLSTIVLAYLVANAVYCLTLHPLAGVPGPKLCAISRLTFWIHCLQGQDVQWMHKLHQRYGPVLRFGPTDLSYANGQAWKDVYGNEKGRAEAGKAREVFMRPANNKF